MSQVAVPIDLVANDWDVAHAAAALDDRVATHDSDTSYVTSSSTSAVCEVALEPLTDPASSSGHKLKAVYRAVSPSGPFKTLDISLIQGTTVIATKSVLLRFSTWSTVTYTLSAGEANSITDYADLRIRIDNLSGTQEFRVSSVEFEIPGPTLAAPVSVVTSNTTAVAEDSDAVVALEEGYGTHDGDLGYIETTGTGESCEVELTELDDPYTDDDHVVKVVWRATNSVAFPAKEFDVSLVQGTTVIGSTTIEVNSTSWQSTTFEIDAGDAATITNYRDLRIRIDGNTGNTLRVSAVEFEVPFPNHRTHPGGRHGIKGEQAAGRGGICDLQNSFDTEQGGLLSLYGSQDATKAGRHRVYAGQAAGHAGRCGVQGGQVATRVGLHRTYGTQAAARAGLLWVYGGQVATRTGRHRVFAAQTVRQAGRFHLYGLLAIEVSNSGRFRIFAVPPTPGEGGSLLAWVPGAPPCDAVCFSPVEGFNA